MDLDLIDRRLIAALETSPRAGMLQLARDVGVARNTAQAHLDRLLAAGVITGFGPDVDLTAAGYGVSAWVSLQIAQGRADTVDERLLAGAHLQPRLSERLDSIGDDGDLARPDGGEEVAVRRQTEPLIPRIIAR